MSTIRFRIAAKTDVGLVRTNNEDNFQASSDLSNGQMRWVNNEICSLGDKGALIVVADGMGGMNAGEVASELAIETIREYFSPDKLTADVLKTRFSIEKHMNDAIIAADSRIKVEAKKRPETKGMGTTIVVGWILGDKLYVSWCGDSRAYIYNSKAGLHQITKDHSYVQGLVDRGSITREEAFDFPDSNIITRCLSDSSTKAKPESLLKPYDLCDNDIVMLCTDGLSGMIRDTEIEDIMRSNEHDIDLLADNLINAACEAEGSDNITICLCQILQGGGICDPGVFIDYDKRLSGNRGNAVRTLIAKQDNIGNKHKRYSIFAIALIAILIVCGLIWWFGIRDKAAAEIPTEISADAIEETVKEVIPNEPTPQPTVDNVDIPQEARTNTAPKKESAVKAKPSTSIFETPSDTIINDDTDPGVLTIIEEKPHDDPTAETTTPTIETKKYKVKRGDTYNRLARKFHTTIDVLKQLNDNAELKQGMELNVPK